MLLLSTIAVPEMQDSIKNTCKKQSECGYMSQMEVHLSYGRKLWNFVKLFHAHLIGISVNLANMEF